MTETVSIVSHDCGEQGNSFRYKPTTPTTKTVHIDPFGPFDACEEEDPTKRSPVFSVGHDGSSEDENDSPTASKNNKYRPTNSPNHHLIKCDEADDGEGECRQDSNTSENIINTCNDNTTNYNNNNSIVSTDSGNILPEGPRSDDVDINNKNRDTHNIEEEQQKHTEEQPEQQPPLSGNSINEDLFLLDDATGADGVEAETEVEGEAECEDRGRLSPDMSHLDMEEQRECVYRERWDRNAEYHEMMAQRGMLRPDQHIVSLKILLHEAHRLYMRRLRMLHGDNSTTTTTNTTTSASSTSSTHSMAERTKMAENMWRGIATQVSYDIDEDDEPSEIRRRLSCMCMFNPSMCARSYSDNEAERVGRQARQREVLNRLCLQAERNGNPYFLEESNDNTNNTNNNSNNSNDQLEVEGTYRDSEEHGVFSDEELALL